MSDYFEKTGRVRIHKRVGEILLDAKLLTPDRLQWMLELQATKRRTLGELAVRMCGVPPEAIEKAITAHLKKCYPDIPADELESFAKEVAQT